jgi:hypothetical protein
MRLLKLLAYGLLGYVIYEMWRGIRNEPAAAEEYAARDRGETSDLGKALDEDTGRMMNMTGTGRGSRITTEDSQGTSVPHLVGRGVTH